MKYPKTLKLEKEKAEGHYFSKIKLHGTNAHISITKDQVRVGSRGTDFFGCANGNHFGLQTVVDAQLDFFKELHNHFGDSVLLGEWCGRGIQKKVACSQLENRTFFIFGIYSEYDVFVFEPEFITAFLGENKPKELEVLPYFKDYNLPADWEQLEQDVAEIDKVDPYIKERFGIEGVGEGLVLYRESRFLADEFEDKVFKLKGAAHQSKPRVRQPDGDLEFKFLFSECTEEEYEKALEREGIGRGDLPKIPVFLKSLITDQQAELQGDYTNHDLVWSKKMLSSQAVKWFKKKA